MFEDGPQKLGRFLKGSSKLIDKVKLSDFSFKELCEVPLVLPDNSSRSIIHTKYHPESVDSDLVAPDKFFDDFNADGSQRRPILQPIDFTAEVEAIRKRKKANRNRDDDDFMSFGEFGGDEKGEVSSDTEVEADHNHPDSSIDADFGEEDLDQSDKHQQNESGHSAPDDGISATENENPIENMNAVGNAINNLVNSDKETQPPPLSATDPTAMAANINRPSNDFVPVEIKNAEKNQPYDPEETAQNNYQNSPPQAVDEEKIESLYTEAKSKGYEEGFKIGEEKALIQARSSNAELFGKVSELVGEFSNLKRDILENVQDNFYEITLATAEALIKKEFSINPDSFKDVLNRAVQESIQDDSFKIRVHPEMLQKIETIDAGELKNHLIGDKEIAMGDFKIESQLSVVNGDIRKIIQDMLDNTDLNLFDDTTKAS